MDERELTRQLMAPDVYPSTVAKGRPASAWQAAALVAILTAPLLLAVLP